MTPTLFGEVEARYAALAGLVQDARVLDLGTHSDGRCVDALVTAGTHSVTLCADESIRAGVTTGRESVILVEQLGLPLAFEAASFDVVICFDLLERMRGDEAWATALREVLTPTGAIVVACTSTDEAREILGPLFGDATIFAQSPLVGHMIYDVEAEELEPELDRTWADDSAEAEHFLVMFAPEKRRSEKLTLVQVPFAAWQTVALRDLSTAREAEGEAARELARVRDELEKTQWELGSVKSVSEQGREAALADARTAREAAEALRVEGEVARYAAESARSENETLRGELEAVRVAAENARAEIELLRAQSSGDSSAQAQVIEELNRHRNDRMSLEAQIADMLEESARFDEQRGEWHARWEAANAQWTHEQERLRDLEAKESASAEQMRSYAERLGEYDVRIAEYASRVVDLEERLAQESAQALAVREQLVAVEHERDEERTRVAELQVERDDARTASLATSDAQRDRIGELTTERDADRERIAELTAERDAERERAAELTTERDAERERAAELTTERDTQRERIATLMAERERTAELEQQLRDAQEELDATASSTGDELALLKADVVRFREEADAAVARRAELETSIAELRGTIDERETLLSAVNADLSAMRSERETEGRRNDDLQSTRDQLTTRLEELQRTSERESGRAEELQRTLEHERDQVRELSQALDEERAKRRELEANRERAQEAEELLARARLETVDAVESLRQERVRGEQILGRLVDLEKRLAPRGASDTAGPAPLEDTPTQNAENPVLAAVPDAPHGDTPSEPADAATASEEVS